MKTLVKLMLPGLAMLLMAGISSPAGAQEKEDVVFTVVEDMPQFQGGDLSKFQGWIMKNVKYPQEALKKKISGKVFASFVIDVNGNLTNLKIKKGIDPLLDKEVLRVIKSSPKWSPGKQRGKAVKVSIVVPVHFKLS